MSFELKNRNLSFYDEKTHSWVAEKGTFKVLIGNSSRDIRREAEFDYIG